MPIGVSIVHFVIKVPKLVQMIVTIYRVQAYQIPIVNPWWPQKSKMAATKFSFLTFQYQTAVISRASSRSPCLVYFHLIENSRIYHKNLFILLLPKKSQTYRSHRGCMDWYTKAYATISLTCKALKKVINY